jgi:hypothetical protein
MRKAYPANELLVNSLYDFGETEPKTRYLIVMERTTNCHAKIDGLQTKNDHCFNLKLDMQEAAEKLRKEIKAWQKIKGNWVNVEVNLVKRFRWEDFVLYVQLISPSFTPATSKVLAFLVWEQDYVKLEKFIVSLIEAGPYPHLPTISHSA